MSQVVVCNEGSLPPWQTWSAVQDSVSWWASVVLGTCFLHRLHRRAKVTVPGPLRTVCNWIWLSDSKLRRRKLLVPYSSLLQKPAKVKISEASLAQLCRSNFQMLWRKDTRNFHRYLSKTFAWFQSKEWNMSMKFNWISSVYTILEELQ